MTMAQTMLRGMARFSDRMRQRVVTESTEDIELRGETLWTTAELTAIGDKVVIAGRGPKHTRRHRGQLPAGEALHAPVALLSAVALRVRQRRFEPPSPELRAGIRDAAILTAGAALMLAFGVVGGLLALAPR